MFYLLKNIDKKYHMLILGLLSKLHKLGHIKYAICKTISLNLMNQTLTRYQLPYIENKILTSNNYNVGELIKSAVFTELNEQFLNRLLTIKKIESFKAFNY